MAENEIIQSTSLLPDNSEFLDALRKLRLGVMVHDMEGRIVLVDDCLVGLTGYTREELLKLNVAEIEVGLDKSRSMESWKNLLPGKPLIEHKEIRKKDGSILPVQADYEPSTLSGQPCVLNHYRDIDSLEKAKKSFEAFRNRFLNLVHLIPDLVFHMREDGHILEMYGSGQHVLLGQPVSQCVGKNIRDVFLGASVLRILECWSLAVTTHQPQVFDFKYTSGKQEHYYEVRCLMGASDEAVFLLRDITDRKASENKINELLYRLYDDNEELQSINRMKNDFLSQVSHELRTPLTSILGYLRLLLGGAAGPINEGQSEFVQTSIRNAMRLHDLVNNLLDLSRSQSNQFKITRSSARVSLVLGNALGAVKNLLDEKKIKIELKLPDDFEMMLDEPKLERVFINLLGNSVKFTDPGGKIEMGVNRGEQDGRKGALFWVKDTGMGIPAKDLENVFKEFFQVDNTQTRKVSGTGLGLAISKKIVEGHGGRIWVESVEGQGSTFWFFIPAEETEPSGAQPDGKNSKG
jgi:PAS domain S-box-containing protein